MCLLLVHCCCNIYNIQHRVIRVIIKHAINKRVCYIKRVQWKGHKGSSMVTCFQSPEKTGTHLQALHRDAHSDQKILVQPG